MGVEGGEAVLLTPGGSSVSILLVRGNREIQTRPWWARLYAARGSR